MANNNSQADVIKLSRLLLQKGIAFSVYRFPGEYAYNIAIQKEILSYNSGPDFIIAPFAESMECGSVLLQSVSIRSLPESFFHDLQTLPDQPVDWADLPEETGKSDYLKKVNQYLAAIHDKNVLKAILSRVKIISKPKGFDPFDFYNRLAIAYPETFASLFYLPGRGIWAGASPELLLRNEKSYFHTIALAATLPKNAYGIYSWRKKEENEHDMVRQHIEHIFTKYNCRLTNTEGPYSFETGQVAHLKTEYTFEQKDRYDLKNIIADLHPTPAVGGLPVKDALRCIRLYEGYSRQYYTGYLGETNGQDYARLFINLRCMQIGEKEIALYTGSGISAESDPEEEWNETIQKSLTLREMIKAAMQSMPN